MSERFALGIRSARPSQLYLDADKLASVIEWFDFDDPEYGPLPVFERGGEYYLADGHTRAFAAHLAGVPELRVERDPSIREEYDMRVYRACIEWCREEGVETVADLAGRVVSSDAFQEVWIERCHEVIEDEGG